MTCLSICVACKYGGSWAGAGKGHCYMFKVEPVGVCAKFEHVWGLAPMPEEMATTLDLLKKIKELETCLFQAQQAAKSLAVDAARYRWLRDPCSPVEKCFYSRGDFGRGFWNTTMLDDSIDAAMKSTP